MVGRPGGKIAKNIKVVLNGAQMLYIDKQVDSKSLCYNNVTCLPRCAGSESTNGLNGSGVLPLTTLKVHL